MKDVMDARLGQGDPTGGRSNHEEIPKEEVNGKVT